MLHQPLQTERLQTANERCLNALFALDPFCRLQTEAHQVVEERLRQQTGEVTEQDPLTDVLGSARLVAAAKERGLCTISLARNVKHEITTALIEALQAEGHISQTKMEVDEEGKTHVGTIFMRDLILRGIHPGWSEVLNEFGEIDYHFELLSEALFKDIHLRQKYDLVQLSLLPTDRYADDDELLRYGFRADSKKWVVDSLSFDHSAHGWQRKAYRLFMSGSDTGIANDILRQLGVVHAGESLSTTQIRRRVFLVPKSRYAEGAVAGIGRQADERMSAKYGGYFWCGRRQATAPLPEQYQQLAAESLRREQEMHDYMQVLTNIALDLAEDESLTFEEQNQQFCNAFILALQAICTKRPEYAEHAFGLKAAWLYQEAKRRRETGDVAGADNNLAQAKSESKVAYICNLVVAQTTETSAQEVSAFASLEEKYPNEKIMVGDCSTCGTKSVKVGPCLRGKGGDGICNTCDTSDRLRPGFVQRRLQKQQRIKARNQAFMRLLTKEQPTTKKPGHAFIAWQPRRSRRQRTKA